MVFSYEFAGDALNLEEPDVFDRAMLDFLTGVDSATLNESGSYEGKGE